VCQPHGDPHQCPVTISAQSLTTEAVALSDKLVTMLRLPPRLRRLLSAVHEAGHAIVAHTVDVRVRYAEVTSYEYLGVGNDHINISMPDGRPIPLAELLVIRAAGFQASYMWLRSRGFRDVDTLNQALSMLAAGDIADCTVDCQRAGRPELGMQDGIDVAAEILQRRWPSVLRLGYELARTGTMDEAQLWPVLLADQGAATRSARDEFRRWRAVLDGAGSASESTDPAPFRSDVPVGVGQRRDPNPRRDPCYTILPAPVARGRCPPEHRYRPQSEPNDGMKIDPTYRCAQR
jgi:hypothetical protein